jgi:hypothetical protein
VKSTAAFSLDGLYRYELRREWDTQLPPLVCIMLNPSTADQYKNDPTIARVMHRASRMGFGSVIIGNLGAGRATKPSDWKQMVDPIGPENKRTLRRMLYEAHDRGGKVMIGWGANAPPDLAYYVLGIACHIGVKLYCLGTTMGGHPLHPLHVPYSVPLRRFREV